MDVQAPRPRPGPRRSIDLARRAAADARRRSLDTQVCASIAVNKTTHGPLVT